MTVENAKIIRDFMTHIKDASAEDFMRSILYCFSAPTIKGLKAGCLINFRRGKGENMRGIWRLHADEWLDPLGLEWILLNEHSSGDNALVLIYRRDLLAEALGCDDACDILREHGYPLHDVDACLECLRGRVKRCPGFPHEIGLFLDYPPEDVRGFIEGRCAKSLACPGYWKVYGNPDEARKTFSEYRKAECEAALLIMAGRSANINSGG